MISLSLNHQNIYKLDQLNKYNTLRYFKNCKFQNLLIIIINIKDTRRIQRSKLIQKYICYNDRNKCVAYVVHEKDAYCW